MNVLITGATGFIGRHLLKRLIDEGHHCRCLVRNMSNVDELFKHPKVELFQGDVTKPKTLKAIGKNIDVVYHLVAAGHVTSVSDEDLKVFFNLNVDGTKNIMKTCGQNGVKRFIHFSSTAAMGLIKLPKIDEAVPCRPQAPYQQSKYESELAAFETGKRYGMEVIIIRPCMVYGPGGKGEFLKFCRLIKKGLFPKVGMGKNLTPIVHVYDVVQAARNALDKGRAGEVYLVASETSSPFKDIHKNISKSLGVQRIYFYVPFWLAYLVAYFVENYSMILRKPALVSRHNIKTSSTDRTFDISKARKELNYAPSIKLAAGIKETIDWYIINMLA